MTDEERQDPAAEPPEPEVQEPVIEPRAYRWDPRKGWSVFASRVGILALIVILLAVLWLSRAVLVALVFAFLLTFLIEPPVAYFRKWGVPRVVTAVLILLLAFGLLVLSSIALAPVIAAQFDRIGESLRQVSDDLLDLARGFVGIFSDMSVFGIDLGERVEDLQNRLRPGRVDELIGDGRPLGSGEAFLRVMTGVFVSLVGGVASFVLALLLAVVFALYLTHDLPRLSAVLRELIPDDQLDDLTRLRGHLADVWKGFFKGQIVLAVVFGSLVALTMWIVGLPAALLMGLIAGVMDLVPTLGALVAGSLVVVVALVQGSTWIGVDNLWFAVLVLGLYSILQWIEGSLLQPRILGGSVRLPGSVTIIGIVVGAASAGVLGAYLAVPVVASGREIFLYFRHKYEESMAKRELFEN